MGGGNLCGAFVPPNSVLRKLISLFRTKRAEGERMHILKIFPSYESNKEEPMDALLSAILNKPKLHWMGRAGRPGKSSYLLT